MTHSSSVAWDRSPVVAAWRGLPSLDDDLACDLCVVGLGASGLGAVRWGSERGLDVVGVDAGRVGGGAAGRNGGFLLGGLARFHHQVVEQLGPNVAVDIYRRTLAELDQLKDRLGPLVRPTGSVRLAGLPGEALDAAEAHDRERELADCREQLAALTEAGITCEWFDDVLGSGLFMPDDASVNPAERCVTEAAKCAGLARLYEHSPALRIEGGPKPRVTTKSGAVTASAVVVCVDGGLERLVHSIAGRVRSARLQMLGTEPVDPTLSCPVYGRWGYDYAQQLPDGRLVVGGGRDRFVDSEWHTDATPTAAVQEYLDGLAARFAGRLIQTVDRWAGIVAFTDDGLPVCELVDEGVAVAGAYNGTGNLVGPLVARAAAALALGEAPEDWPPVT